MSEALAAPDDCMICYETPQLYGLLECNHKFCLECIKCWRGLDEPAQPSLPVVGNDLAGQRQRQEQHLHDLTYETAQPLPGIDFTDDDNYTRDRYRAAMSAMHAGTFELGPFVALNSQPSQQLAGDAWMYRNNMNQETQPRNTKACPLCRQPSKRVYAAAKFPETPAEKQKMINGILAQKKRTLCRDFEASIQTVEGFYCPRFNDCLYAHLYPSDDPDRTVRTQPFIFENSRIAQLKQRRALEANRASLLSFLYTMPHLPAHISTHLEELLRRATEGLGVFELDVFSRELVSEFFAAYEMHLITQEQCFRRMADRRAASGQSAGRGQPGTADNARPPHHIYHLWNEDGDYLDLFDRPVTASHPTFTDFATSVEREHHALGMLVHHFMSPLSTQEAEDNILCSPDYQALRATIASDHGTTPAPLQSFIDTLRSQFESTEMSSYSFFPPGASAEDLLARMAEDEELTDDEEWMDDDEDDEIEDEQIDLDLDMPALVRITSDVEQFGQTEPEIVTEAMAATTSAACPSSTAAIEHDRRSSDGDGGELDSHDESIVEHGKSETSHE